MNIQPRSQLEDTEQINGHKLLYLFFNALNIAALSEEVNLLQACLNFLLSQRHMKEIITFLPTHSVLIMRGLSFCLFLIGVETVAKQRRKNHMLCDKTDSW